MLRTRPEARVEGVQCRYGVSLVLMRTHYQALSQLNPVASILYHDPFRYDISDSACMRHAEFDRTRISSFRVQVVATSSHVMPYLAGDTKVTALENIACIKSLPPPSVQQPCSYLPTAQHVQPGSDLVCVQAPPHSRPSISSQPSVLTMRRAVVRPASSQSILRAQVRIWRERTRTRTPQAAIDGRSIWVIRRKCRCGVLLRQIGWCCPGYTPRCSRLIVGRGIQACWHSSGIRSKRCCGVVLR